MAGEKQNRIFLRIPLAKAAFILLNGQLKKVKLTDLSSKGLSFLSNLSETIPDELRIQFKLKYLSRMIKIVLQVKNRLALPQGAQAGCVFKEISDKDRKAIERYICNSIDISFPEQAVNFAAFLCSLDAFVRALLGIMRSYYGATGFGSNVPAFPKIQAIALALYLVFSILAFIFSSPRVISKAKQNFKLSLYLLAFSFIFLLLKNFYSWKAWVWGLNHPYVKIFLSAQLLLFFYLGFAIFIGRIFLKKINSTLEIIKA